MSKERWKSPFPYTLAFNLFKKHFTEINSMYWAFLPASNTIKQKAKEALSNDTSSPLSFFLIPDEDDKRVASTFGQWKEDYNNYCNYTRLNTVMLLSSCLETYLRTVISLSFESKPGVIIQCPDSVDGVFLLKANKLYGNCHDNNYQFNEYIDDICTGEWTKRFVNFSKYFGQLPESITNKTSELDDFRTLRNNIAHHFGRTKREYAAPLLFDSKPAIRVSPNRVMKLFRLVYDVAKEIDKYLKNNFIGSYDIVKIYYQYDDSGAFKELGIGKKAKQLQELLGQSGLPPVGSDFYINVLNYCNLSDNSNSLIYSKQSAINEINRRIREKGIKLDCGRIHRSMFNKYIIQYDCKSNEEYCKINSASINPNEYLYSDKLISRMVEYFIQNMPHI